MSPPSGRVARIAGPALAALAALVVALGAAPAAADDDGAGERPWAAGVSEADQAEARVRYERGNDLFAAGQYSQALAEYQAAVAHFDHPAIRFNLAVTLIRLDRPLDADPHLDAALHFGAAPFDGPELYARALDYRKLLDGRLVRLTVRCPVAGARVTLDGRPVLEGPGQVTRTVLPGDHELVARKREHVTVARTVRLAAGTEPVEEVAPVPFDVAAVARRRWRAWRPWLAVAGGAALVGTGALLEIKARADLAAFTRAVDQTCPPTGCPPGTLPDPVVALERRGRLESRLGVAGLAVGGAVVVSGLVLVYLNRSRLIVPGRHEREAELGLAPAPGGATATVRVRF